MNAKTEKRRREEREYRNARLLVTAVVVAGSRGQSMTIMDALEVAESIITMNRIRPLPEKPRVQPFRLDVDMPPPSRKRTRG